MKIPLHGHGNTINIKVDIQNNPSMNVYYINYLSPNTTLTKAKLKTNILYMYIFTTILNFPTSETLICCRVWSLSLFVWSLKFYPNKFPSKFFHAQARWQNMIWRIKSTIDTIHKKTLMSFSSIKNYTQGFAARLDIFW